MFMHNYNFCFHFYKIMEESQVCLDGEDLICVSELSKHISDLKDELRGAQGDLDHLKQELTRRDSQLEQKTQELKNLTGKVKVILFLFSGCDSECQGVTVSVMFSTILHSHKSLQVTKVSFCRNSKVTRGHNVHQNTLYMQYILAIRTIRR